MINPTWDRYHRELQDVGALAFSPPETQPDGSCGREVENYHLCAAYDDVPLVVEMGC